MTTSSSSKLNSSDKVQMNFRSVPRKLRDEFKALCAINGTTMQSAVIRMMQKAVDDQRESK